MTEKSHMPVTIAILMIQRVGADRMRGRAMEARIPEEVDRWNDIYNDLGREIRNRLQFDGFVKDCEIDSEMELLAIKAADACEELSFYINKNSITFAD